MTRIAYPAAAIATGLAVGYADHAGRLPVPSMVAMIGCVLALAAARHYQRARRRARGDAHAP